MDPAHASLLQDSRLAFLYAPARPLEDLERSRAVVDAVNDGYLRSLYVRLEPFVRDPIYALQRIFPNAAVRQVASKPKYILCHVSVQEISDGIIPPDRPPRHVRGDGEPDSPGPSAA